MDDESRRIRESDRRQLRRLIDASPRARVVTVRGEAGLGKTTLLAGLADDAAAGRLAGAAGHRQHGGARAQPGRAAPAAAAAAQRGGCAARGPAGGPGGRLRAGRDAGAGRPLSLYLACLTLLSQQAGEAPLLLVVDDAQWIDQHTLDVLAFVARRLADDPIALVFGSREAVPADLGPDSRTLDLAPLTAAEASRLLDLQPDPPAGQDAGRHPGAGRGQPARAGRADPGRRRGPGRGGGLARPGAAADRAAAAVVHRLGAGPARADSAGAAARGGGRQYRAEPELSQRSARGPADAWEPAQAAGLIVIAGGSVAFRHPLIRSAVYQASSPATRAAAHRALAAALEHRPDRQAWQLAAAATGPDEPLARRLAVAGRRRPRERPGRDRGRRLAAGGRAQPGSPGRGPAARAGGPCPGRDRPGRMRRPRTPAGSSS